MTAAVCADLEKRIKSAQASLAEDPLLADTVTPRHIAHVIARQTGIPVESLLASEQAKLLKMEEELGARVVGQDYAIAAVADCVRMSKAGLSSHKRPLGVFMFLGPTGVGKVCCHCRRDCCLRSWDTQTSVWLSRTDGADEGTL